MVRALLKMHDKIVHRDETGGDNCWYWSSVQAPPGVTKGAWFPPLNVTLKHSLILKLFKRTLGLKPRDYKSRVSLIIVREETAEPNCKLETESRRRMCDSS